MKDEVPRRIRGWFTVGVFAWFVHGDDGSFALISLSYILERSKLMGNEPSLIYTADQYKLALQLEEIFLPEAAQSGFW